jgi:hypothetical protein
MNPKLAQKMIANRLHPFPLTPPSLKLRRAGRPAEERMNYEL